MKDATTASTPRKSKGRPRGFDREVALHRALEVFWKRGYEPATVTDLCAAMGVNAPSLYAAFGSKAQLFMEAVEHYESSYWAQPWQRLDQEPCFRKAAERFFRDAAAVLSSLDAPCGCLVVLAAANVSSDAQDIHDALKELREITRLNFHRRVARAVADRQLPEDTAVETLADLFTTILLGMSVQARDGVPKTDLERIGRGAMALLPAV